MRHQYRAFLAAALGLTITGHAWADLQNHAVALSGRTDQYGPGFSVFGDVTFGQFGHATINNAGQVAFGSSNSDFSSFQFLPTVSSIMLYRPGVGLELIARTEGNGGPGGGPAPFQNVANPFLSANGSVAFFGMQTGASSGFQYRAIGQSVTTIARQDVPANTNPVIPNASYSTFTTFGSYMFRGGHLAFGGTMQGAGITFSTDDYLARSTNGATPELLARESISGSNPLGTDNGSRTWGSNFVPQGVNSSGDVVFLSGYSGGQFGEPSMFGKINAATGDVTTLAVSGDAVPGAGGAYTFIQGSGRAGINDAGDVVFMGRSGSSNPNVLLRHVGGTTQFLAKSGDTIGGVTITGFNATRDPVITGNSTVLFQANVGNTGAFGLFRHTTAGGFEELFETNNPAKGPGGGVSFGDINSISANANGDFTFMATLFGPGITGSNDQVLYAYRNGQLEVIAREGSLFDFDPSAAEDLRPIYLIVSDTQLINTGGQDGRRGNINDNGDVVYSLVFQTAPNVFSAGVFVSPSVPEPASIALLGGASVALLARRSRRGRQG